MKPKSSTEGSVKTKVKNSFLVKTLAKKKQENQKRIKENIGKLRQKKLDYLIKNLDLHREAVKGRKCIVIQIDALSYTELLRSVDKGYAKNLRKLINKKGWHVQQMNPGIPSNTSYFQSTVFFGDNTKAPGHHLADKKKKRFIKLITPDDAKWYEEKYFGKGILKRGSSYSNVFSGSAKYSFLTMSTITKQTHYRRIPLYRLLLSILINPFSLARVVWQSTKEIALEIVEGVADRCRSLFDNNARNPLLFSLARVFFNVLAGELITLGAIVDMSRKVPFIWMDYIAYDELGHHRGPETKSALRVLASIDKRIGKILKNAPEDYDIFILSDHGMTRSIPFEKKFGYSFPAFVEEIVQCPVVSHERFKDAVSKELFGASLLKMATLPFIFFKPITALAKFFYRRWYPGEDKELFEKNKVLVEESTGLAHIYFTQFQTQLTHDAIKKHYPRVIEGIAKHPGVGILCTKTSKGVQLYARGEKITNENKNLLKNFGEPERIEHQLTALMNMQYCGDIVIFPEFDGRTAISFADHYGLHSGLGGPQNQAFILAKPELLPKYPIDDALELHHFMKRYE